MPSSSAPALLSLGGAIFFAEIFEEIPPRRIRRLTKEELVELRIEVDVYLRFQKGELVLWRGYGCSGVGGFHTLNPDLDMLGIKGWKVRFAVGADHWPWDGCQCCFDRVLCDLPHLVFCEGSRHLDGWEEDVADGVRRTCWDGGRS